MWRPLSLPGEPGGCQPLIRIYRGGFNLGSNGLMRGPMAVNFLRCIAFAGNGIRTRSLPASVMEYSGRFVREGVDVAQPESIK